jgi:uncharacterized protein YgiM (DUF1202 family)
MRKLGGIVIFGFFAAIAIMVLLPRDLQNFYWLHFKSKPSAILSAKLVPANVDNLAPAAATPDVTTLGTLSPAGKALVWYKLPATIVPAAATAVAPVLPPTDFRYTTASGLNMRAEPSVDAALVVSLQKGSRVAVLQSNGHWLQVTTDAGQTGWLSSNFVTAPTSATPSVAASAVAPTKPQDNQLVSSVAK